MANIEKPIELSIRNNNTSVDIESAPPPIRPNNGQSHVQVSIYIAIVLHV